MATDAAIVTASRDTRTSRVRIGTLASPYLILCKLPERERRRLVALLDSRDTLAQLVSERPYAGRWAA